MIKTIESVIDYAEQIAKIADRLNHQPHKYASDCVCFGKSGLTIAKQRYIIKDVLKNLINAPRAFNRYAQYAMRVLYPRGVRGDTDIKTAGDLSIAYKRLRVLIKSEEIPLEVLNIFDYAFTYIFTFADKRAAIEPIYQVASVVFILLYLEPEFSSVIQRYWLDNE
ncbi:MAG: hypothetical protein ACTTIC_00715 [Helicobacteraceae bacterium]